jgi:hypothetical protein
MKSINRGQKAGIAFTALALMGMLSIDLAVAGRREARSTETHAARAQSHAQAQVEVQAEAEMETESRQALRELLAEEEANFEAQMHAAARAGRVPGRAPAVLDRPRDRPSGLSAAAVLKHEESLETPVRSQ